MKVCIGMEQVENLFKETAIRGSGLCTSHNSKNFLL